MINEKIINEKYIFIDFDGVCSAYETPGSYYVNTAENYGPTPRCVELIKRLAVETGSKIVISSNWRKYCKVGEESMCQMTAGVRLANPLFKLKKMLGGLCIGMTSHDKTKTKGEAILEWLDSAGLDAETSKYVVLDDQEYPGLGHDVFFEHFIKTDPVKGFSSNDYIAAKRLLS